jgi:hypothetical protein
MKSAHPGDDWKMPPDDYWAINAVQQHESFVINFKHSFLNL